MTETQAKLNRFEEAIQSLLDNPLDGDKVREWMRLRTVVAAA